MDCRWQRYLARGCDAKNRRFAAKCTNMLRGDSSPRLLWHIKFRNLKVQKKEGWQHLWVLLLKSRTHLLFLDLVKCERRQRQVEIIKFSWKYTNQVTLLYNYYYGMIFCSVWRSSVWTLIILYSTPYRHSWNGLTSKPYYTTAKKRDAMTIWLCIEIIFTLASPEQRV